MLARFHRLLRLGGSLVVGARELQPHLLAPLALLTRRAGGRATDSSSGREVELRPGDRREVEVVLAGRERQPEPVQYYPTQP